MNPRPTTTRAFSLVEMLSVIAVIGIISAIALPAITDVNESATEAAARRNAQNIASIYQSARSAGLDFYSSDGIATTVGNVVEGGIVEAGVFEGNFFGLQGLSSKDQAAASDYLTLAGTDLLYEGAAFGILDTDQTRSTDAGGAKPPGKDDINTEDPFDAKGGED